MQMGVVEYESIESLLLALTNFPAADIAKCPPNLIEKARQLLQSVPVPSSASSSRSQDKERLVPVTVPSTASSPRTQEEECLVPVTVPSSASPPKPQEEEGHVSITVSGHVPLSNEPTRDPAEANTAAVETKAREVFEALLEAIKETKDLLEQDVKNIIRDDLSPAAYDPRVQDLEAGIGNRPSNSQKLRHIIVLPKWLKEYEYSYLTSPGRGALVTFSAERGMKYGTAKEGMIRARRLRDITRHYGKSGLEAPLGLIVWKWKRLTEEVRLAVARLCREDSSVTEARPALSKFYEECDAEYTVLLNERLAAARHPVKSVLLAWETRPDRIRSGFVEDTEVEEQPIDQEYGFVSEHEDGRVSTKDVGSELSTTVARRENQHGIKRSFEAFVDRAPSSSENSSSVSQHSDDVPLLGTRPSSVCTGSTAVAGVSGAQNQEHESVAEEGYRPSEWESIRARINAGDPLAPFLERLLPGECLNDEVINLILPSFPWGPDVRVLNTFFLNLARQPDRLSREWQAPTTQLVVPVCRLGHWTLLHVFLGSREIHHYDSWSSAKEHGARCSCRLMAQAVDQVLNTARRGEWKFRINVEQGHVVSGLCQLSLQQSDTSNCGVFALFNGFCISKGINPRAYSFNPEKWRLKWAKELMQPRDVIIGTSILSNMQKPAQPVEKPNSDSTLSANASLAVAVRISPRTNELSVHEQIGEEPAASPELTARIESENGTRPSGSMGDEAQNIEEENDGRKGDKEGEVEGEKETGSGEEGKVELALSGGNTIPNRIIATTCNKRSSTRPEDTDTTEQQDMDVLFGSNQNNIDQLPYNNLMDDSPGDQPSHIPSRFDIYSLEEVDTLDQVHLDQPSRFDIHAIDELFRHPSRFDMAKIRTINPAALNI